MVCERREFIGAESRARVARSWGKGARERWLTGDRIVVHKIKFWRQMADRVQQQ